MLYRRRIAADDVDNFILQFAQTVNRHTGVPQIDRQSTRVGNKLKSLLLFFFLTIPFVFMHYFRDKLEGM